MIRQKENGDRNKKILKALYIKTHGDAIIHTCWNESWNFVLRCDTFFFKCLTNTSWKHL